MGAQPHWFYRHAVVTVVASGFLGLALGIVIAIESLPKDFGLRASEGLRPFGFLAVSGGSFLLGILVGVLLVRAGRSGTECPRCGTLNPEGSVECSACGLSLA
jgi:hypothetical protein